jgi:5,5'-dehydrodivanillate O-demethylase oxygenase subunit
MLTKEQNKRFTEVGPGTKMGDLLRRYWMPFATVKQLEDHPTRAVTLLGEHLVAYKDRSGTYGLIQEFCPHRNVNLLWGIPEAEGLRCPYHGWLYNEQGSCLEQPAEPPDSSFKDRIKLTHYPVEELGGMLWAWLGPEPRPLLPRWEVFLKPGFRSIGWEIVPCNWLQIMENSLDPTHTEWLHGYFNDYARERQGAGAEWRDKPRRRHAKIGFDVVEYGIIKRRVYEGDDENHPNWRVGHPVVFPITLALHDPQIRVPMDDTHTLHWYYDCREAQPGDAEQRPQDIPIYKIGLPGVDTEGLPIWDLMHTQGAQDDFAWNSQGPVTPRWTEHLGESDKGIILLRRLVREQMKIVEAGGDPINTYRDPAKNVLLRTPVETDGVALNGTNQNGVPVAPPTPARLGRNQAPPDYRPPAALGQIHPREPMLVAPTP